ncbi:SpaA isopeptide-forming pilin-related protein, partial [Ruminococcus sp.]|uniref:SpaA isopeptide-forming pilin-related protein n=1 Tax=Ruminococcus sp. TaxID=41978 RepID=UPI0025D67E34
MKKTIGKRIVSGVTALLMAASVSVSDLNLFSVIEASAEGEGAFSYAGSELGGVSGSNLYAGVSFTDANGKSVGVNIPDNTYYLLVHAVGDDGMGWGAFKYEENETKETYKLIEISGNTSYWKSEKFDLLPSIVGWGGFINYATTVSVDGKFIKSANPDQELTINDAVNGWGCTTVDNIEGFKLSEPTLGNVNYFANPWTNEVKFTAQYDAAIDTKGVNVNVLDYDQATPAVIGADSGKDYYVLAGIYSDGSDEDVRFSDPDAWAIAKIDPKSDATTNLNFWKFTDSKTGEEVFYETGKYYFDAALYAVDEGEKIGQMAELKNKGTDQIFGYTFFPKDHSKDPLDITLYSDKVEYEITIDSSDDALQIGPDDNVFVRVDVKHNSGSHTYFVQQLKLDGDLTIPVQTVDEAYWRNGNGNPVDNERYHGAEEVKVNLVVTDGEKTVEQVAKWDPNSCYNIEDGGFFNGYEVTYTNEEPVRNEDTKTSTYKTVIKLDSVEAASYPTYAEILGNGIHYGFVADRYEQGGHTETNLAVNYYQGKGDLQSDLSGYYGGDFYIANFVKFDDPTHYTIDPDGKIILGDANKHTRDGCTLHVDSADRQAQTTDPTVAIVIDDPDNMKNNVIDPLIKDMQDMSAELLNGKINAKPLIKGTGTEQTAKLDTTGYPKDATIYVDGDEIKDTLSKSGALSMKILDGQTIVFNFDDTEELTINQYTIEILDENGDPIPETAYSLENSSKPLEFRNSLDGNQNTWLDQVTRHVVWNAASADELTISNSAGIFLVPKENSETTVQDSSTGWLHSAGYVTNNGEWHFVFSEMGYTGQVKLQKTDITGENEIAGATLTIFDANGKRIASWKSTGGEPKTIALAPGEYTLKETGEEFEAADGTVYTVTESEFKFKVIENPAAATDDQATRCLIVVEAQDSLKEEADPTSAEGYYLYDETSHQITLCDASKSEGPATVVINKYDLTGENEIAGATITVSKKNEEGEYETKDEWQWTSTVSTAAAGRQKVLELEDGEYKLEETGETVVTEDGIYEVVASELTFTIAGGKLVKPASKVSNISTDGFDSKAEASYYTVGKNADNDENVINICDAKCTDVTLSKQNSGNDEVEGASLTVTGTKDNDEAVVFTADNLPANARAYSASISSDGKTVTWTSGTEPFELKGLPNGTYTFHEETAPRGYQVANDIEFTVKNGVVTLSGANGEAVEGNKVVLLDSKTTAILLNKFNLAGDEVTGAKLILRGISEGVENYKIEWVSSANAACSTGSLKDGTYELTETSADGKDEIYDENTDTWYSIIDSKLTFSVKDGRIVEGSAKSDGADVYPEFTEKADEEYYYVYSGSSGSRGNEIGVCNAEIKSADITVNKYDITGDNEIAGAVLTITGDDIDWDKAAELNPDSEKVVENGKTVGLTWTSVEGQSWNVKLRDGSYSLTETGFATADSEYEVIPSSVDFTISDGKVSAVSSRETTLSGEFQKSEAAAGNESYAVASAGSNEIFVCDAKKVTTTKVTINKFDITGEEELEGAILTIKDEEGNTVGEPWTSKKGEKLEVELENGTYTLTESGDKIVDEDGNEYDVIESSLTFKVEDGKVTVVENKTTKDSGEGFYEVNEETNEIVVSDAKK